MPDGYVLSTPDRGQVLDKLIELLNHTTDIPWGDLEAPAPNGKTKEIEPPYGIVYPIAVGATNNATRSFLPDVNKLFTVQLSTFGLTRKQADRNAHVARRVLTDKLIGASGYRYAIEGPDVRVIDRRHAGGPGTTRAGSKWFRSDNSYILMLTTRGPEAVQDAVQ